MVPIQYQATTHTRVDPLHQRFLLAVSTLRAVLACVGWIDRYKRSTGPCCLVSEMCSELRPGGILNTFGQTVIMHHRIDGQIFHRNDVTPIDEPTAFLMTEVAASVGNTLMDPRHN